MKIKEKIKTAEEFGHLSIDQFFDRMDENEELPADPDIPKIKKKKKKIVEENGTVKEKPKKLKKNKQKVVEQEIEEIDGEFS